MKVTSLITTLLLVAIVTPIQAASFPGNVGEWHGFDRFDFQISERNVIIVSPKKTAPDRPWVWRARFFGHEPQFDTALLEHGFHLAYIDVSNLFGSPKAVDLGNDLYQYLVTLQQFHPRPVLEGMSRGGLMIYNWARANPKKVGAIYADAPVLDFKSWPGGTRRHSDNGQQRAWEALLKAYDFPNDDAAMAYQGNPVDHAEFLVKHRIPLFHVCGDSDAVVPYAENTGRLKSRYFQQGGTLFFEIVKPHIGHHPHSLPDPKPLIEFLDQYRIQ